MAKKANDALRAKYVEQMKEWLASLGEDVMYTGSNELAFPVVDGDGNETAIVITVKVPTGTRDGDAYDPYEAAQDYKMKQELKAAKEKERERVKAEKIAKQREAKARVEQAKAAKAAREAEAKAEA